MAHTRPRISCLILESEVGDEEEVICSTAEWRHHQRWTREVKSWGVSVIGKHFTEYSHAVPPSPNRFVVFFETPQSVDILFWRTRKLDAHQTCISCKDQQCDELSWAPSHEWMETGKSLNVEEHNLTPRQHHWIVERIEYIITLGDMPAFEWLLIGYSGALRFSRVSSFGDRQPTKNRTNTMERSDLHCMIMWSSWRKSLVFEVSLIEWRAWEWCGNTAEWI